MQDRNTILNELKEVAPVIAEVHPQEIYTVPAGYFEHLPETILLQVQPAGNQLPVEKPVFQVPSGYFDNLAAGILQKIKAEEKSSEANEPDEFPLLKEIQKNNPYQVPASYFEQLPEIIMQGYNRALEIEVEAELKEVAPLLTTISRENIYRVPVGFFEELIQFHQQKQSVHRELDEVAPLLIGLRSTPLYHVPAGFFPELPSTILAKIGETNSDEISSELNEIAPTLNQLRNKTTFTTPEGYFENLRAVIPQKAKVVPLKTIRKWYSYAAAACVAGLMIFAGTTWFKNGGPDLSRFKQMANTNVQKEVAKIDDDAIISYLDHQPVTADFTPASGADEQDPDVTEYIHSASNDEIESYLNDNAEPGENKNVIKKI